MFPFYVLFYTLDLWFKPRLVKLEINLVNRNDFKIENDVFHLS